jgi:hypothetical protein
MPKSTMCAETLAERTVHSSFRYSGPQSSAEGHKACLKRMCCAQFAEEL